MLVFALGRSEFKILSVLTLDSPETAPEITNAEVAEITAVLQSLPESLFLPRDTTDICLFGRRCSEIIGPIETRFSLSLAGAGT